MSTDPALLWNATPPAPRQPKTGELLFEFLRGHDRFRCELRYHGEWGVEAQFYQNEEFMYGYRLPTRGAAIAWASSERDRWLNDQSIAPVLSERRNDGL